MDFCDRASEQEEMDRQAALKRREADPRPSTGQCDWCGAKLDHFGRYCDAACQRDHALAQWQHRQRRRLGD